MSLRLLGLRGNLESWGLDKVLAPSPSNGSVMGQFDVNTEYAENPTLRELRFRTVNLIAADPIGEQKCVSCIAISSASSGDARTIVFASQHALISGSIAGLHRNRPHIAYEVLQKAPRIFLHQHVRSVGKLD